MTEDAAELLRKWAAILEIPGGHFVNHELRFAADEIDRLRAEVARLNDLANAAIHNQGALTLKLENDLFQADLYFAIRERLEAEEASAANSSSAVE